MRCAGEGGRGDSGGEALDVGLRPWKTLSLMVFSVKLANEVTYKRYISSAERSSLTPDRMNQTMAKLQSMPDSEMSIFVRVLFGHSSPTAVSDSDVAAINPDWISGSLNDSQKDAIKFALASREVALIPRPPGTGKTTTLIELILQLVEAEPPPPRLRAVQHLRRQHPSSVSPRTGVPIVRLGHPARLLPSVLVHSSTC